jgi:hypothetical protein
MSDPSETEENSAVAPGGSGGGDPVFLVQHVSGTVGDTPQLVSAHRSLAAARAMIERLVASPAMQAFVGPRSGGRLLVFVVDYDVPVLSKRGGICVPPPVAS